MADARPRTTICVVPRDHFSSALGSLQDVLAGVDGHPFRMVYVDGASPPRVASELRRLAAVHDFTLVRTEHFLTPNEARNLAFTHVHTEFVAFVDNDIVCSPGWLAALERSADRHGAAVVAPVYGVVRDGRVDVHLAGGSNHFTDHDGRRFHAMAHHHEDEPVADVMATVRAAPTEQAEFHCFFARTDAISAIAPLDERLLSLQEHLDASLRIRERGGTIWLEPEVMVSYVVPRRFRPSDAAFLVLRWSHEWSAASLEHFAATWGVDRDDPESKALLRQTLYWRKRAYRPYRSLTGRIQERRGRVPRPLPERVLTPWIVRRGVRRRREARPPRIVHRATWEGTRARE